MILQDAARIEKATQPPSRKRRMDLETAPSAPALPFSAETRRRQWEAAGAQTFDLLVIGGGITGAGAALDAACRGLDVALVDAGDFGEGTSSRSSRLIHGGLRYLETFELGLVFEALRERGRLLRLAPHLVRPLPFLFPVYRGDPVGPLRLAAGMWLYDALTLFRGIRRHQRLSRAGVLRREPRLRHEGLRGGAVYYDAQVDDARLTLAVARAAHEAGALALPHAAVVGFVRGEDGRVAGVRLRDAFSGEEREVRARLIVSATGPWTDELRRLADPAAPPRLRPTKGVHIVLPRARVGNEGALIFRSGVDGRVMFVLPWGRFTYVGTTDTDLEAPPHEARASAADVDYLLASANALFPEAALTADDVVSTWAGVRPLLAPAQERSAGATSREHEIWRDPSGLLCVAGGKLTTYRAMAAELVDTAAALLRTEHGVWSGDCLTELLPLPGAPEADPAELTAELAPRAEELGLEPGYAGHLVRAYGTEARRILELAAHEPDLARPICPPLPYRWAEVRHAVREEMALSLADVLVRRLHLLYETTDGGLAVAARVARFMAAEPGLDWDDATVQRQVDGYRELVGRTLGFREA